MSQELELPPEMWACLEALNNGDIAFDERGIVDRTQLSLCGRLENIGYAKSMETGPGGSVMKYSITAAGERALKSHQADSDG